MKFTKNQWIALAGICCSVIICITMTLFVFFFNPQRTFTITETFRITSASDSETYLRVALPIDGGYQAIEDLLVEGAQSYVIDYFDGWRELVISVPASGGEVLITISYTATLFRNVSPWEGIVFDEYTSPQQFIDSDDEAIIILAAQLRGDNDFQTAQNIHDYVYELLSWPSASQINTTRLYASELLVSPVGVCGDFANLMIALLRAEGIPARNISGLALQIPLSRASDWSHQGDAHAWVEFYVDGSWHFADPSWGLFGRNATTHLSFGTFDMYVSSNFQQNRGAAIEDRGFLITGWMTAPLNFIFYSTDENATILPRGEVRFSWLR